MEVHVPSNVVCIPQALNLQTLLVHLVQCSGPPYETPSIVLLLDNDISLK